MARSAKRPEPVDDGMSPLREATMALGGAISRNPVLVGGCTAFLVTLFYVSANALWYQPHFHKGAFFATRDVNYVGPPAPDASSDVPETTIRIDRTEASPVRPVSDPVVERVQSILKDLKFYNGTVDGVAGPNTRSAVEAYRRTVGLPASGDIDAPLLEQLGASQTTSGILPKPVPAPRAVEMVKPSAKPVEPAKADPDPMIIKIQAGLKAFGNDGIEIDGVIGSRTKSAIKEFQSLFGLPVTGEPDKALYAKMREIGLTN